MKKRIKFFPLLVICLTLIGSSFALAAPVIGNYSCTPAGLGDTVRTSDFITKTTSTNARQVCTVVQDGGSLYCWVRDTGIANKDITSKYLFTSGSDITMSISNPTQYVGDATRLYIQSQPFDVYGRNTYGIWSPDMFN